MWSLQATEAIPQEYEAIYRASHAVSTYPTRSDNAPQRRKREDDDDDTEYGLSSPSTDSMLNFV